MKIASGHVRRVAETLGGVWELLRMAVRSRLRMSGPYWRWRRETAFGSDPGRVPRLERLRQVLAYGRWVYRMRRGR